MRGATDQRETGTRDAGAALLEAPPSGAQPSELSDLLRAFNEVTGRLQATHERLSGEVERLQGELREANRRLRRSRELAALGEMAAGIAHEIRNPLGSIGLYAEMLVQDLDDRPGQREVARKIGSAVRGLNAIVGDVLAFSREMSLRATPVELGPIVAQAADACAEEARAAGAAVALPDGEHASREALCDPDLLRQALVNVIRNAIEAVGEREGERSVSIGIEPASRRGGDGARSAVAAIVVRDSGPGIPGDVLSRMFNPFFTTRRAGTGLGLAIVHRILDAHGGAVEVANGERGGAVVRLLLPIEEPGDASGPGADREQARTEAA